MGDRGGLCTRPPKNKENNALSQSKIPNEMLRAIFVDYVVHRKSAREIIDKYHITKSGFFFIKKKYSLIKKREDYHRDVIVKALEKLGDKQSEVIVKSVGIFLEHVKRIDAKQKSMAPNSLLDADTINDVLKIHQAITKEKRLDEDKPTDNLGVKVTVVMGDGLQVIGDKPIETEFTRVEAPQSEPVEEAKAIEVKQPEKVEETKTEETKVDVDESLVGVFT